MTLTAELPPRAPVDEAAFAALADLVRRGRVVALTGAGVSTGSGIPDYRGPDGSRRVTPMHHGDFLASADNRRRYWARSYAGWTRFRAARPNPVHHALARLETAGLVEQVITQNVDGLHQAAGSRRVLDLHGTLARVGCLRCGENYAREVVHEWMTAANPRFGATTDEVRPDGDVVLDPHQIGGFRLVHCVVCGSDLLQPDVVFFGGSVPKARVERAFAAVEGAAALLVLGSSLQVMSGYRFVRRADRLGTPVAVVTRGRTRGDAEATLRLDALLQDVLPRLADEVTGAPRATGATGAPSATGGAGVGAP
ncbi:NAD-dependent protein deacetylase [Ornithinicoccus halotolerans]|uniref:NAD-dependent protein deacetylase n=1 Tax=Ornithinicoccus halotolerans TaxID=1748220 RepID=UPI001885F681|nr:NAD-dependent protein deacetylase [Ornithinicoccus halotolerans]